jgi:hypothetical protein
VSTTFSVVTPDGKQHDGVDESTVRQWYQRHYLRDHSYVIVTGGSEWRPLFQVFDVRQWQQPQSSPAVDQPPPTLQMPPSDGSVNSPPPTVFSPAQPQAATPSALLPPGSYAQAPAQQYNYYQKPVVFASAYGLGIATIVGVFAMIITRIIHLVTYYGNDVYIMSSSGRSLAPPDVAATAYLLYGLFVLVFIATGVIYSLWVYRANKNLRALGHTYTEFTPGWAVGYFFVPFVNLVKPYQVVNEIWTKSDSAESSSGSAMIGFWWVCFLLLGFANWIGTTLISARLPDAGFPLVVVSMIANVGAGIMLTAIIIGVQRRQEERLRVFKENPEQLSSAAPHSSPYSLLT